MVWFLCSPVLPIAAEKHLRTISIALRRRCSWSDWDVWRRAGPAPLRARSDADFATASLAPGLTELIYAAAGALLRVLRKPSRRE